MALSCLYLSIATVLSVFKLEKAIDENGHVITPSRDYISSMILCVVIAFDRSRVSTDNQITTCADILRISSATSNLGPKRQKCWSGLHLIAVIYDFILVSQ